MTLQNRGIWKKKNTIIIGTEKKIYMNKITGNRKTFMRRFPVIVEYDWSEIMSIFLAKMLGFCKIMEVRGCGECDLDLEDS